MHVQAYSWKQNNTKENRYLYWISLENLNNMQLVIGILESLYE